VCLVNSKIILAQTNTKYENNKNEKKLKTYLFSYHQKKKKEIYNSRTKVVNMKRY
jgi:hypothetical protein